MCPFRGGGFDSSALTIIGATPARPYHTPRSLLVGRRFRELHPLRHRHSIAHNGRNVGYSLRHLRARFRCCRRLRILHDVRRWVLFGWRRRGLQLLRDRQGVAGDRRKLVLRLRSLRAGHLQSLFCLRDVPTVLRRALLFGLRRRKLYIMPGWHGGKRGRRKRFVRLRGLHARKFRCHRSHKVLSVRGWLLLVVSPCRELHPVRARLSVERDGRDFVRRVHHMQARHLRFRGGLSKVLGLPARLLLVGLERIELHLMRGRHCVKGA